MYVIILVTQIINANEKTPKKHKKCFGQSIFIKSKMDILKCPFSISQFTFA